MATDAGGSLSIRELESTHWHTLRLRLPPQGVASRFPSEDHCRRRLIEVRWPDGPRCPRCETRDPLWIETRALFQCEKCRHQFSVTSGTILHRSRLALGIWFRATEQVILFRSSSPPVFDIPSQLLAGRLEVQYVAAYRMRKIILEDIRRGGWGLLSTAICVEPLNLPDGVAQESEAHHAWLVQQVSNL